MSKKWNLQLSYMFSQPVARKSRGCFGSMGTVVTQCTWEAIASTCKQCLILSAWGYRRVHCLAPTDERSCMGEKLGLCVMYEYALEKYFCLLDDISLLSCLNYPSPFLSTGGWNGPNRFLRNTYVCLRNELGTFVPFHGYIYLQSLLPALSVCDCYDSTKCEGANYLA